MNDTAAMFFFFKLCMFGTCTCYLHVYAKNLQLRRNDEEESYDYFLVSLCALLKNKQVGAGTAGAEVNSRPGSLLL
jgi:hypothetical protein